MFCSNVCFFDGIRIWNKYIFILFHYRFNITHSNLDGEIMLQSHVTETVNNNGIFKSKMLQIKIVSYSIRSPSSRSHASCFKMDGYSSLSLRIGRWKWKEMKKVQDAVFVWKHFLSQTLAYCKYFHSQLEHFWPVSLSTGAFLTCFRCWRVW